MRNLIIIPTYNEVDNIRPLAEAVFQTVPAEVDLLFVDDNSPDGTGQLADQLAQSNSRIHVLHREKKMGLGTAYVHGFQWGLSRGYDALIEMDADFSHHPRYLKAMLDLLELNENDVVIGSRYVPGGGYRKLGIRKKNSQ